MFPAALSDRLDAMIDELIMDGGVESASLASILIAAKDSLNSDSLVTLSRIVWDANNEIHLVHDHDPKTRDPFEEPCTLAREHVATH